MLLGSSRRCQSGQSAHAEVTLNNCFLNHSNITIPIRLTCYYLCCTSLCRASLKTEHVYLVASVVWGLTKASQITLLASTSFVITSQPVIEQFLPQNLRGIECMNGPPSFTFAIRDWVHVPASTCFTILPPSSTNHKGFRQHMTPRRKLLRQSHAVARPCYKLIVCCSPTFRGIPDCCATRSCQ